MSERRAAKVGAILVLGFVGAMLSFSAGCDTLKPKAKRVFAEACVQDTDCESSECATYGSICSKSCTYDKDCGDGLVCRVKDVGTGNQCSKPAGTPPGPNSSCKAASECQNAQCLRKTNDQLGAGICSKYCQDASECPAGMKICDSISDSGALKLCLPGDEKTPATQRATFSAPKPVATIKTGTDAGTPPVDAGGTPPAPTVTDAGVPPPAPADGGGATPTPTDAGVPKDAGSPAVDAGGAPTDAGPRRPIIRLPTKK